jgi:hypothetical protein
MRIFRTKEQILSLLREHQSSNLSIKAFCEQHNVSNATFNNWRKRFAEISHREPASAFTTLKLVDSQPSARLFAEVNNIRIYQFVDATYLKELM